MTRIPTRPIKTGQTVTLTIPARVKIALLDGDIRTRVVRVHNKQTWVSNVSGDYYRKVTRYPKIETLRDGAYKVCEQLNYSVRKISGDRYKVTSDNTDFPVAVISNLWFVGKCFSAVEYIKNGKLAHFSGYPYELKSYSEVHGGRAFQGMFLSRQLETVEAWFYVPTDTGNPYVAFTEEKLNELVQRFKTKDFLACMESV